MAESSLTGGLYVALITPFDGNEDVDLDAFRAITEYVIAGGVDGLVVAGTTGEAHALTFDERQALWRTAVAQSGGRVPVMAGAGATTTREAKRLLALAADCGCDSALVLSPWFETPSTDGLLRHYAEIAAASALPILLYHNPSRTHYDWSPESIAAVGREVGGPVAGYKDALGDADRVARVRAAAPEGFLIFAGGSARRPELHRAGADGCIDDLANAIPAESADAFAGDERQLRYVRGAAEVLSARPGHIGLLKGIMMQLGLPAGRPRRPHDDLDPAEVEALRERLSHGGRLQASPASLLIADDLGLADEAAVETQAGVHLLEPGLVEACVDADPVAGETATVYRPERGQYQYNHHAAIVHFDGRLFASWSGGRLNEDSPGQTILVATSDDGLTWSDPVEAVPIPEGRKRWTCGQFWVRGGELWLLGHHCLRARYVDGECAPGVCWEDVKTEAFRFNGERWEPKGVIVENLYVNEGPRPLPDGAFLMTGENGRHEACVARGGRPGFGDWDLIVVAKRSPTCKMSEPTWFAAGNGTIHLLMRDDAGSRRIWLSESTDLGRTWSAPVPTDFTDAQSKLVAVSLSDGRLVLVNNPAAGDVRRRLLTVAVSEDGRTFARMHTLRSETGRARLPGMHKVPGADYPHAIEHDGRLWVIYAVNKEDIELRAIPLDAL